MWKHIKIREAHSATSQTAPSCFQTETFQIGFSQNLPIYRDEFRKSLSLSCSLGQPPVSVVAQKKVILKLNLQKGSFVNPEVAPEGREGAEREMKITPVQHHRVTRYSNINNDSEAKWLSDKNIKTWRCFSCETVCIAEPAGGRNEQVAKNHKLETETEMERGSREAEKFPVQWPSSRWTGGVLFGPWKVWLSLRLARARKVPPAAVGGPSICQQRRATERNPAPVMSDR